MEALLSKKFILAVIVSIGFFVLAIMGRVSHEQLLVGLTLALGIYTTSNVTQKVLMK